MQIQISENRRELKDHGDYSFPFMTSFERLSLYEKESFSWHWHPEIELTLILDGEIEYQVNEKTYHLKAGDGLFCNSNMLHTGRSISHRDCRYLSVTFHPRLLYGYKSSLLDTKYVTAVLESPALSSLALSPLIPWQSEMLGYLRAIQTLCDSRGASWELEAVVLLYQLWLTLFRNADLGIPSLSSKRSLERLRSILLFIQEHYSEKITLDEIASCISISKSECCRFFRSHMHQPLFDYLLQYRVEQSLPLLLDENLSVTEIAFSCGFSTPSYYTKIFRRHMGCTPRAYREAHLQRR